MPIIDPYWAMMMPLRVQITYWDAVQPPQVESPQVGLNPPHDGRFVTPTTATTIASKATATLNEARKSAQAGIANDWRLQISNDDSQERWVGVEEVAAHLGGLTVYTIRAWAKVGKIPAIRPGNRWLFRIADVDAALSRQRTVRAPDATNAKVAMARHLRADGMSATDIARTIGVARATAYGYLKE